MKSQRKHELRANELADAINLAVQRAKPHARTIGYVAAAAVALVVILFVLPAILGRAAPEHSASAAYAAAQASGAADPLREFLQTYPKSPAVPAARLLLADRELVEVVRGASAAKGEDAKAKAAALLADAKEQYGQVAESDPALEPLARVGLALVTVQEGDVEKGRAALHEVIATWPLSIGAEKAKANFDALAGYKPVEFTNEPVEPPEEQKPEAKPAEQKPAEVKPAEQKPAETPAAPPAAPAPKG
jgi:TolA-binding protein